MNAFIFFKYTHILVRLFTKANENYVPTYAHGILDNYKVGKDLLQPFEVFSASGN